MKIRSFGLGFSCAILAAIAVAAPDLTIPTTDLIVDLAKPQKEFTVRTSSGSTPTVRAWTQNDGAAFNHLTTNWTASFYYYATNWPATNWVAVSSSSVDTNSADFAFTAAKTATNGTFRAQIVFRGPAGQIYRFAQGSIVIDYVPPLLYGGGSLDLTTGSFWEINGDGDLTPK